MDSAEVVDLARMSVWTMIKIGAPVMLVALVAGLIISLLQALTQIQEMTLSFVPKILAIMVTFVVAAPFMIGALRVFTEDVFARIAGSG